jgi:hypothetical protein
VASGVDDDPGTVVFLIDLLYLCPWQVSQGGGQSSWGAYFHSHDYFY